MSFASLRTHRQKVDADLNLTKQCLLLGAGLSRRLPQVLISLRTVKMIVTNSLRKKKNVN